MESKQFCKKKVGMQVDLTVGLDNFLCFHYIASIKIEFETTFYYLHGQPSLQLVDLHNFSQRSPYSTCWLSIQSVHQ